MAWNVCRTMMRSELWHTKIKETKKKYPPVHKCFYEFKFRANLTDCRKKFHVGFKCFCNYSPWLKTNEPTNKRNSSSFLSQVKLSQSWLVNLLVFSRARRLRFHVITYFVSKLLYSAMHWIRLCIWRKQSYVFEHDGEVFSSFEKRTLMPSHIKQVITTRSFSSMINCAVPEDFLVVSSRLHSPRWSAFGWVIYDSARKSINTLAYDVITSTKIQI